MRIPTVEIHRPELKEKGVIIFDGEHIDISPQPHLLSVPLERLAREKEGNKLFSNSVAVGAGTALATGIRLQNMPEGLAVVLPLMGKIVKQGSFNQTR